MKGIPHKADWSGRQRAKAGKKARSLVLTFGRGEKKLVNSSILPMWPIQCQRRGTRKGGPDVQCKNRAAPGLSLCQRHEDRAINLAVGTRKYLMWVLGGNPALDSPHPWTDLLVIEAVSVELLRRSPPATDRARLEAATLLLKCTQWIDSSVLRSKINPKKALIDAGLDNIQVAIVYDALHQAGWLPDLLEDVTE